MVLDVAHAGVHFDVEVARAALAQGLPPTTLSTDMVKPAVARRMYDLLGVMSTFLALGMPLAEVIRGVTDAPARAIGQAGRLGVLAPGASGDAAVLDLEEGDFTFGDAAGHEIKAARRLVPVLTVRPPLETARLAAPRYGRGGRAVTTKTDSASNPATASPVAQRKITT